MADLYGTNTHSSPPIESEEMSSLLHNLLHNSSPTPSPSPSPSNTYFKHSSNPNFSDTGLFFPTDTKEKTTHSFYSAAASVSANTIMFPPDDDVDDFGFGEEPQASEEPANPAPSRSTKRTRAAQIHNLSEKRRRSKINEKLKALQNLIPNSNKTDKASMLDEAIEYLKQLQLQVQMLTMRNGLSLQPVYLPEKLQPMQLPQRGGDYNEGNGLLNANRGNIFFGNQEIFTPTGLHISSHTSQNQPNLIPLTTNVTNSETSYGIEPLLQNHYGLLNHLTPSKDFCSRIGPLDASSSGKNPSSGVS